jgi:hypothetical protein
MATGFVDVFESSDGGTGDPTKTVWQFFVAGSAFITKNSNLAETVRLAIETNSQLMVTADANNTATQVRIAFKYQCTAQRVSHCEGSQP